MYGNLHDCALKLKLNEYKSAREDSMFYQAVSFVFEIFFIITNRF